MDECPFEPDDLWPVEWPFFACVLTCFDEWCDCFLVEVDLSPLPFFELDLDSQPQCLPFDDDEPCPCETWLPAPISTPLPIPAPPPMPTPAPMSRPPPSPR